MQAQSDVFTLVASDTATVTGGAGTGGVVTGVVVAFTAGAGVVVVAFTTGGGVVGGAVVVVVAPIGTVTAGMAKPANDVLDNTDVGVMADA